MTREEYLALADARELETKKLLLAALDGQLPAGYVLSDNPNKMHGNAMFHIKPKRMAAGSITIHFIHRLEHRLDRVDGVLVTMPTSESIAARAGIFDGKYWETHLEWGTDGRLTSTLIFPDDIGNAAREVVSATLTQSPFVNFEWKRDGFDPQKHHLFNGKKKMGSAWRVGNAWGTSHGNLYETLKKAKTNSEGAAKLMIKSGHDERISRLSALAHSGISDELVGLEGGDMSKHVGKKALDQTPRGLDSDEDIRAIGTAMITDVGQENVYLEKDGKAFYFKPANNSRFVVGEYDFSDEVVFGDGLEQDQEQEQESLIEMGAP